MQGTTHSLSASTAGQAKNFFISYNHQDSHWAEWIAWQLEGDGYTTIIQAWDFGVASNFVLAMDEALKRAERVIAVLSPHYFDSQFAPPEWAAVFAKDPKGTSRKIVPVRVQEVEIEGLLNSIVYVDLVGKDEAAATHELLTRVKEMLTIVQGARAKPPRAPVFPGKQKPTFPGIGSEDDADEEIVEDKRNKSFAARRYTVAPFDDDNVSSPTTQSVLELFDQLNPRDQLHRIMLRIGMPDSVRPSDKLELYHRQDKIVDWAEKSSAGLKGLEKELKALIAQQSPDPHR